MKARISVDAHDLFCRELKLPREFEFVAVVQKTGGSDAQAKYSIGLMGGPQVGVGGGSNMGVNMKKV